MAEIIFLLVLAFVIIAAFYFIPNKVKSEDGYVSYDENNLIMNEPFDLQVIVDAVNGYNGSKAKHVMESVSLSMYREFMVILEDNTELFVTWENGAITVIPVTVQQ